MNPKVSWLICTNKYDSLLCRAIDSCLNQTYDDFELILVVNGSSRDNIQKNINLKYSSDSRVTVLSTPINLLNFSLNFGLNFARGKYVARMDADDIAYPNRLMEQVKYLDSNPGVVVVCSSFDFCDDSNITRSECASNIHNAEIRRRLFFSNPICHPSVMFRANEIRLLGGYLGGKHAEDYDLWVRVAANHEWHFYYSSKKLIAYNKNPNGLARKSRQAYANLAAAQLRNFLLTFNFYYLLGVFFSIFKSIFISRRS